MNTFTVEKSALLNFHTQRAKKTAPMAIGNLEINSAAHKVFVNGTEVPMTAKEYELLYFLASPSPGGPDSVTNIFTMSRGNLAEITT